MVATKIERKKFGITLDAFMSAKTAPDTTFLIDEKGAIWSVFQRLTEVPIITLCHFENTERTQTIAYLEGYGVIEHDAKASKTITPRSFYVVGDREVIPCWRDHFFIVRSERLQCEYVIGPFLNPNLDAESTAWIDILDIELHLNEEGISDIDFQISFIFGHLVQQKTNEAFYMIPELFVQFLMSEDAKRST